MRPLTFGQRWAHYAKEYHEEQARLRALRKAELAQQVGAVVFYPNCQTDGRILCNECLPTYIPWGVVVTVEIITNAQTLQEQRCKNCDRRLVDVAAKEKNNEPK